jgi:hypothetical protein
VASHIVISSTLRVIAIKKVGIHFVLSWYYSLFCAAYGVLIAVGS